MTKNVFRVEAKFVVKAVYDVIAETEEEAENLASDQPREVQLRAVTLAIEQGEYHVDAGNVAVEDLGGASEADIARTNTVLPIRP